MIQLINTGSYQLSETDKSTKIIIFEDDHKNYRFAWVHAKDIGDMLVTSKREYKTDHILAVGKYRYYEVRNEPSLINSAHLELLVGDGRWQGYILPAGMPNGDKKKKRIIPVSETITQSIR